MNKLFIIAALFLASCASKTPEEAVAEKEENHDPDVVELSEQQYKSVGVELGGIINTNLSNYIKASGSIDVPPQHLISITSPYGGIIRSTNILEGRYVPNGGIIATLENPEFVQIQQDYLESSSQLEFLKQDLARQEQLVKENIAARKSLQRASSEFNSMEARVEGLKAKLRMINVNPASIKSGNFTSKVNILAPQRGYITRVYTNVGKFVSANEAIADMANTSNIMVRAKVFEKDVPKIRLGQNIRFKATGDSAERTAPVFLIGKDIDADRTVEVFGKITGPSEGLLPGMFVNAIVELGAAATKALPQQAIVQAGGKNYIFILQPDDTTQESPTDTADVKKEDHKEKENHVAFRRVEVGTGVTENGYTAVTIPDNFSLPSKIVIKGAYDLLSKMNNSDEEEGH